MHLSDIAPHNPTRDLILLNQQRLAEIELSNQLERKEEELRVLSTHLAAEKKKTRPCCTPCCLSTWPTSWREGRKVAAGEGCRPAQGALLAGGALSETSRSRFGVCLHRLLATVVLGSLLKLHSLAFFFLP